MISTELLVPKTLHLISHISQPENAASISKMFVEYINFFPGHPYHHLSPRLSRIY